MALRWSDYRIALIGLLAWVAIGPGVGLASVPAGRTGPVLEYDAARSRVLMWGSLDFGGGEEGTLWSMSLAAGQPACWTALPATVNGIAPNVGYRYTHCFDAVHDRILLFGGSEGDCVVASTPLNQWKAIQFTGPTTWQFQSVAATGVFPTSRYDYSLVYDPVGNRAILFGGRSGASIGSGLNDAYQLTFTNSAGTTGTWSQIPTPAGMPRRWGHQAVYDQLRHRMIVFGGYTSESEQSGMVKAWVLDLTTMQWTEQGVLGLPPRARYFFGATYDQENDEILVYSGQCFLRFASGDISWYTEGENVVNVMKLYSTSDLSWGSYSPSMAITTSPRTSGSVAYDPTGDRMIVFGGFPASFYYTPLCPQQNTAFAPLEGALQVTRIQVPGMGWDYGQWSLIADCGADPPPGGGGGGEIEAAPSLRSTSNPLGHSTDLRFTLARRVFVRLEVFDEQGRRVRILHEGEMDAGVRSVEWDRRDQRGASVSRGIYFARLQTPLRTETFKMVVTGK